MWKTERHFLITTMSVALLLCGCDMISDSGFTTVEATVLDDTSNLWGLKLQANEDGVIVKSLKINNGSCKVPQDFETAKGIYKGIYGDMGMVVAVFGLSLSIEDANKSFSKKAGGIWSVLVPGCVGGIQTLKVHTNRGANAFELSYSR